MSQRLLESVEGGARKEFFSKADGLRIGDQEKNWVGPYEAQQAVRSGDPFQFLGWVIRNSTDRAQDILDASLVERVRRRGGQRAARIEKMFNEGKNIPKRDEDFMRNLMKASMGANAGGAAARANTDSPKEDPFQAPLALSKIPSAIQTTLAQGVPAGDRKGIEELAQWAASLNYPPSRADVLNQAQKLGISRATAAKIVRKSN